MSRQRKPGAYAMKRWLDLSKPMPTATLTLDDVWEEYVRQHKVDTGRKLPMETYRRILAKVQRLKAGKAVQLGMKWVRIKRTGKWRLVA